MKRPLYGKAAPMTKQGKLKLIAEATARGKTFESMSLPLMMWFADDFCLDEGMAISDMPVVAVEEKSIKRYPGLFAHACYTLTLLLFSGNARTHFENPIAQITRTGDVDLIRWVNHLVDTVTGDDEESVRSVLHLCCLPIRNVGVEQYRVYCNGTGHISDFDSLVMLIQQQVKRLKAEIEKETTTEICLVTADKYSPLFGGPTVLGITTPSTLWVVETRIKATDRRGIARLRFMGTFLKDFDPAKHGELQKVNLFSVKEKKHVTVDIPELKPETKDIINEYLYGQEPTGIQRKQLIEILTALSVTTRYDTSAVADVINDHFPERRHRHNRLAASSHIRKIKAEIQAHFSSAPSPFVDRYAMYKGINLLNRMYRCLSNPEDDWLDGITMRREWVDDIVATFYKRSQHIEKQVITCSTPMTR